MRSLSLVFSSIIPPVSAYVCVFARLGRFHCHAFVYAVVNIFTSGFVCACSRYTLIISSNSRIDSRVRIYTRARDALIVSIKSSTFINISGCVRTCSRCVKCLSCLLHPFVRSHVVDMPSLSLVTPAFSFMCPYVFGMLPLSLGSVTINM